MMPLRILPLPWLAAGALAALLAGFASGYALKGRIDDAQIERLRGEIARIEAAHAAEKQAAAEASARRLAAAQDAGRAAVLALDATRARLSATTKRLKESLYALPTAGRCGLSDAAVGLLDRAAGAAGDLSARAAGPDRAAAGPAADPTRPAASESAVGGWMADAIRHYDECRARLDAIRQWDEVTHGR